MIDLVFVPLGLALLIAAFAGYHSLRELPVSWVLLGAIAVLEVMLLVQLIWGWIGLSSHPAAINSLVFVGYLLTAVIVAPAVTLWGLGDRSRWGTAAIVIGMITTAALCFRVWSIWTG